MRRILTRISAPIKVLAIDVGAILLSLAVSFMVRFDFTFPAEYTTTFLIMAGAFIVVKPIVFYFFGLYRGMFRYTSLWEIIGVVRAVTASQLLIMLLFYISNNFASTPRSIFLIDYILTMGFVSMVRVGIRIYFTHVRGGESIFRNTAGKRLAIIGAGSTGERVVRDILLNFSNQYRVVSFYDDDPKKTWSRLQGCDIIVPVDEIRNNIQTFDEILIAIPSASMQQVKRIYDLCKATGKPFKIMPTLSELISGNISLSLVREVSINDLLGRAEINLKTTRLESFLNGKRILITGGGGSIGSELVRQVLHFNIGSLCILDSSENNLFSILEEVGTLNTHVNISHQLANIKNTRLCERIFREFKTQIIVHAAAYKHVPIQESFPWQAIGTNVAGTRNLIDLANNYQVEKFICLRAPTV